MIRKQGQRQIKTVRCPYIPQHIMPEESLLNHLSRCSAPNKHLFTKCRYNPLHVYPTKQIEDHYKKCKDRLKYEKEHEQSSDEWGSDNQKNQIPLPLVNKVQKREGNRTSERNEKKVFDASCIKNKEVIDFDDSWDPIDIDTKQKPKQKQFVSNQNKSKRVEKIINSQVDESNLTTQNRSFNQQSSAYSKGQKSFQPDIMVKREQKKFQSSSSEGISLNSESFQSKKDEKYEQECSKSKERSFESLRSKKSKKNGDNQKKASTKILTKSVIEQSFEVEDF